MVAVCLTLCAPAGANALSKPELECQQTIGRVGLRFTQRKLDLLQHCDDGISKGKTCNTDKRDAAIARAAGQLAQQLATHCRSVTLENLGFPGECSDPDGGSFSVQNLSSCIENAAESRVVNRGHKHEYNEHHLAPEWR